MGRALAARLGPRGDLVLVSRHADRVALPDGRQILIGTDPAVLVDCAVVLLAVPAIEVPGALARVRPHLGAGAIVVNIATELATSDLDGVGIRLLGCKIIGQSGQIARGVPAALVVNGATCAERAVLARVLEPVGAVLNAPESLVAEVNDRVARRVIAAQLSLVRELGELGVPAVAHDAVIRNLAPGVWQAVASGNTGPFLSKIIEELSAARRGP